MNNYECMKRILVITEIFYPENGLINDFVRELVSRGYEVEVLTQHPSYPKGQVFDGYVNDDYHIEEWKGIKIHRFKVVEGYYESKIQKIQNYYKFVCLGKRIACNIGEKFDHVLVYQTGPLTLALPAVAVKRKFGIPFTIWTFDIWPDAVYAYGFPRIFPLTWLLNSIVRRVYRNADSILVSSQKFEEVIRPYVPDKCIDYVPNWLVEEPCEPASFKLDTHKFNFTFTGNVSKAQNLESVLRGWRLAAINREANLNIVGDGSNIAALKELVKREKIEGVTFYGRHPFNQMLDIMSQSDVLVLSLVSNKGIALTEPFKLQSYLKAGKPILGIIDGAGREIIESNELGICAAPDDINNIGTLFQDLMDFTANQAKKVAERAQMLLNSRFNREKTINKAISYIEKNLS